MACGTVVSDCEEQLVDIHLRHRVTEDQDVELGSHDKVEDNFVGPHGVNIEPSTLQHRRESADGPGWRSDEQDVAVLTFEVHLIVCGTDERTFPAAHLPEIWYHEPRVQIRVSANDKFGIRNSEFGKLTSGLAHTHSLHKPQRRRVRRGSRRGIYPWAAGTLLEATQGLPPSLDPSILGETDSKFSLRPVSASSASLRFTNVVGKAVAEM